MNRSCYWLFCLTPLLCSSCGPEPRAARPTRPDADASPTISSSESSDTKPVALHEVDLVESNWTELQALIEQQKGKLVIVDVWSTACEPCMTEFPRLIELHDRFPEDVVAISFDIDYAGIKNKPVGYYRERVLKFLGEQKKNRVLHRMCTTAAEDLFTDIKLDSIPAVYVYGRDGDLLKRFEGEGFSYEKQIVPFIEGLVKTTEGK